jgi:hypothetical protein
LTGGSDSKLSFTNVSTIDSPKYTKLGGVTIAASLLQEDVAIVLHAVVSIRTTSVKHLFAPIILAHKNGVKSVNFKESCFENSWRKPH